MSGAACRRRGGVPERAKDSFEGGEGGLHPPPLILLLLRLNMGKMYIPIKKVRRKEAAQSAAGKKS